MAFNLDDLLADQWGVERGSVEFSERLRELRSRSRKTKLEIIPCGPPCETCGDNSYVCECSGDGIV